MLNLDYLLENVAKHKWHLLDENYDLYKVAKCFFDAYGKVYAATTKNEVMFLITEPNLRVCIMSNGTCQCLTGNAALIMHRCVEEYVKHGYYQIQPSMSLYSRIAKSEANGYTVTLESNVKAGPGFIDFKDTAYDCLRVGGVYTIYIERVCNAVVRFYVHDILKSTYSVVTAKHECFSKYLMDMYVKYRRMSGNVPVQNADVISSILRMYNTDAARDFELLVQQYPNKSMDDIVTMMSQKGN